MLSGLRQRVALTLVWAEITGPNNAFNVRFHVWHDSQPITCVMKPTGGCRLCSWSSVAASWLVRLSMAELLVTTEEHVFQRSKDRCRCHWVHVFVVIYHIQSELPVVCFDWVFSDWSKDLSHLANANELAERLIAQRCLRVRTLILPSFLAQMKTFDQN